MEEIKKQFSTEIISKHILVSVLAQTLVERIDEINDLDGLWKQKMGNLTRRYLKAIDSHLDKTLNDKDDNGKQLSMEILIATNDFQKGLEDYEKKLIKDLEK